MAHSCVLKCDPKKDLPLLRYPTKKSDKLIYINEKLFELETLKTIAIVRAYLLGGNHVKHLHVSKHFNKLLDRFVCIHDIDFFSSLQCTDRGT